MKVSELFEDRTIPQLQRDIEVGFPNTKKRQHATNEVRVSNLTYTPFTNQKVLRIEGHTNSNSGNTYNQFIDLHNVNYEYGGNENNVPIESTDNHEYYIQPIELNTTNVKVFCECSDYQHRFANFNIANQCHIGPPPAKYVRKPDSKRGPVNPLRVPGFCKHLIRIVNNLKTDGLLK